MRWLTDIWRYGLTPSQRAKSREAEQYAQSLAEFENTVKVMSNAEANSRSQSVLAAGELIKAVPWPVSPPELPRVGPRLASLFSRFHRISGLRTDTYIDATEIEPLLQDHSFLRIGGEAGGHVDIAVRIGEEQIYIFSNDVPFEEALDLTLPSVDHWILLLHRSEELLR